MSAERRYSITYTSVRKQQGAVLMVMLVILIIGAATLLLNSLSNTAIHIERDKKTADVLSQAKQALIGYSAKSSTTPGQLVCPEDITKIGTANEGDADNSCTLPAVGRLPWRTLKTGPLRDADGELLWYAISNGFRSSPINSDNAAQLTVDGTAGSAVAIIFSAGAPINGQSRPAPTPLTPPDVTQYLDLSNNDGDNTFVTTGSDITFNDKLLLVTHDDLFRVVEKRVAKDLQNAFAGYLAANPGRYPNPANVSSCTIATCPSDTTQCRGWIPSFANFDNPNWILPSWFVSNGWNHLVYYSANSSRLASSPLGCNLIAPGIPTTQALFFMTGSQLGAQIRPSNNVQDYLEDLENYNMDDTYLNPGTTATSNDSLYLLP